MGSEYNLGALDALDENSIHSILQSWQGFCTCTESLLAGKGDLSVSSEFVSDVHSLCHHGLDSLVREHFLLSLQEAFERNGASRFWLHFEPYSYMAGSAASQSCSDDGDSELEEALYKALEEISVEKQYQEKCLLILVHALQSWKGDVLHSDSERTHLVNMYQLNVSSVLMASLPRHFPVILQQCFKKWLDELSTFMTEGMDVDDSEDEINTAPQSDLTRKPGEMDIDGLFCAEKTQKLVGNIGRVVRDLRGLGFTSMSEDAYASAIFSLLKAKVHDLAGDEFSISVLQSIKEWIQAVPLQFLRALLSFLGESVSCNSSSSSLESPLASHPSSCYPGIDTPSEGLVRWQLRLEYFAYETLQDLRISKLFEIIVDYPDSSPAIEDLRQCLEYTGQHSKLVDSFISALRYRLLTAGASTNDILHQYVSTIKALRTMDPAGIFLESVGEPIRDYLRGRKDTIKCIVTMLTDGSGETSNAPGGTGESLLEELNRDEEEEDAGVDEEINTDDKQAWINAQRWEPDPVEADPLKGSRSRRKIDILGMIVGIIGSKDQLVNEYRVMLAEKLLNKSDYDIEVEIRTLELLKLHFGEGNMQKCEIMLNDLIDSKRTNSNIKATINLPSQPTKEEAAVSLDVIDATIISSNFWPPIQEEDLKLPSDVDQLLTEYGKRYNEVKTPRKLLWKKNLGTVKLELEFEDKAVEFTVAPIHAAIIMQFQEQPSWDLKSLSAAIRVPVDLLQRRMNFWISKGVLVETVGTDSNDHMYTLVESMADSAKNNITGGEDLVADEGESAVASVEEQLRKEMTVYEKFIMGMLKNFGSMALDRIHNTLKMFCTSDPAYDKSLQQLQSFLSGLVSEEKLELKDGKYVLKG